MKVANNWSLATIFTRAWLLPSCLFQNNEGMVYGTWLLKDFIVLMAYCVLGTWVSEESPRENGEVLLWNGKMTKSVYVMPKNEHLHTTSCLLHMLMDTFISRNGGYNLQSCRVHSCHIFTLRWILIFHCGIWCDVLFIQESRYQEMQRQIKEMEK